MIQNNNDYKQARIAQEFLKKLLHEMAANKERFTGEDMKMPPEVLAAQRESVKNKLRDFEEEVKHYEKWHTGWRRFVPSTTYGWYLFAGTAFTFMGLLDGVLNLKYQFTKDSSFMYYLFGVGQFWIMCATLIKHIDRLKKNNDGI